LDWARRLNVLASELKQFLSPGMYRYGMEDGGRTDRNGPPEIGYLCRLGKSAKRVARMGFAILPVSPERWQD